MRVEVGFADEEFPEWFYSPARAVKKEPAVVPSSDELSEAQEALPSSVKRVHEPVTPRNPIPRERGSGRPPLTEQSSTELNTAPDNSEELDRAQDSSEFSQARISNIDVKCTRSSPSPLSRDRSHSSRDLSSERLG